MQILNQNNIINRYSINILKVDFNTKKTKKSLKENLSKYMIKSEWNKENLSSNIDELLYGK